MASSLIPDDLFAGSALDHGYITLIQLQEARTKLKAMAKMNLKASLQEILERSGALTSDQSKEIRRALGIHSLELPGYQILSQIGAGGMGTVYKAHQLSVDRQVAVKVLPPQLGGDQEFVKRFMNEAKAAAKLCHPNIIAVYDAGEADGMYYLTMEYSEGSPLDKVLKAQGPLPEARVRDIASQMGQALRIIHSHRLLHRDIKPNNILIDKRGRIKLCDFGLARLQNSSTQALTRSGEVLGTPAYMSPEQVNGERKIDIRSDLYALGATLFCLLTGRPPFEAETAMALALKHVSEPPPDPRSINPTVSPFMSKLVLRLLEKDPIRRFQTPEEYLVALNACYTIRREAPKRLKRFTVTGFALILATMATTLVLWPNEGWARWVSPLLADGEQEKLRADAESEDYDRWLRAERGLKDEALKKHVSEKIRAAQQLRAAEQKFTSQDWAGAMAAFLQIRPFPSDRVTACKKEIEALQILEQFGRFEAERQWEAIESFSFAAIESTISYAGRRKHIEAARQQASKERAAESLLAQLAADWDGVMKKLEKYKDTHAFAREKDKIAALQAERDAASAWTLAQAAFQAGRFEEAKKLLQRFLFDFVPTDVYRKNKSVAEEMSYRCDIEIRQGREDKAKSIIARIREAASAQDWREVEKGLGDLAPYEATLAATSNVKFLQETRKTLAKAQCLVFHADFETGIEGWSCVNDKGKPPECEEWLDAREGLKSARMTFLKADPKSKEDSAGSIDCRIEGLDNEVLEIRFWSKLVSVDSGPLYLYLLTGEGTYVTTVNPSRLWKEYSIPVTDFRGKGKLDLAQVRRLGFMSGDRTKNIILIVDSIRLLRPEK